MVLSAFCTIMELGNTIKWKVESQCMLIPLIWVLGPQTSFPLRNILFSFPISISIPNLYFKALLSPLCACSLVMFANSVTTEFYVVIIDPFGCFLDMLSTFVFLRYMLIFGSFLLGCSLFLGLLLATCIFPLLVHIITFPLHNDLVLKVRGWKFLEQLSPTYPCGIFLR